jgi:hypothetical protein
MPSFPEPANARPYLIEMRPDRGDASLARCAYDLLSGVIDGIERRKPCS